MKNLARLKIWTHILFISIIVTLIYLGSKYPLPVQLTLILVGLSVAYLILLWFISKTEKDLTRITEFFSGVTCASSPQSYLDKLKEILKSCGKNERTEKMIFHISGQHADVEYLDHIILQLHSEGVAEGLIRILRDHRKERTKLTELEIFDTFFKENEKELFEANEKGEFSLKSKQALVDKVNELLIIQGQGETEKIATALFQKIMEKFSHLSPIATAKILSGLLYGYTMAYEGTSNRINLKIIEATEKCMAIV